MNTLIKPPCTNSTHNGPDSKVPAVNSGNIDYHVMILIVPELRNESFVKIAKSSSRAGADLELSRLGMELNKKARMGLLPNATLLMFSTNEKTAKFLTHYSGLFETYSTAESLLCSFSKNIRDVAVFPLTLIG